MKLAVKKDEDWLVVLYRQNKEVWVVSCVHPLLLFPSVLYHYH